MKKIAQRIKRTLEEGRKCRVVLDLGSGDPEYFGHFTMDREEAEEVAKEIWARETADARRRWRRESWTGETAMRKCRRLPTHNWQIRVQSLTEHERDLRRERRRLLLRDFGELCRKLVPSLRWR